MHSAASAKLEVAWCASPVNHVVVVNDAERATGRLNADTHSTAIECARRCGFVKVSGAVPREPLLAAAAGLRAMLRDEPRTPLLAALRPSELLDAASWDAQLWTWLRSKLPLGTLRPWEGDTGRAMVDMPFAPPFNASALTRSPLLLPLVEELLGHRPPPTPAAAAAASSSAPPTPSSSGGGGGGGSSGSGSGAGSSSLGIVIEQAAYIVVGNRTGAQQLHTDASHLTSHATDAGVLHDGPTLLARAAAAEPAVTATMEALRPHIESGAASYALNVQLPLADVAMVNGPTALCPATHSEVFCRRFLRGVCVPPPAGQPAPRAGEAMRAYVRLFLCTNGSDSFLIPSDPF